MLQTCEFWLFHSDFSTFLTLEHTCNLREGKKKPLAMSVTQNKQLSSQLRLDFAGIVWTRKAWHCQCTILTSFTEFSRFMRTKTTVHKAHVKHINFKTELWSPNRILNVTGNFSYASFLLNIKLCNFQRKFRYPANSQNLPKRFKILTFPFESIPCFHHHSNFDICSMPKTSPFGTTSNSIDLCIKAVVQSCCREQNIF